MKSFYLALIFCLFIIGNNATLIQWVGGTTGDFSNVTNWLPAQVPGVNDQAILIPLLTVTVSTSITVNQLNSAANVKLFIQSNSVFTINSNFTQNGIVTIQTESGSSFLVPGYFIFDGTAVNFLNFGQASLNPMVTVTGPVGNGVLSNNAQGNTVVFPGTNQNIINNIFYVPAGFQFAQVGQTFTATLTGGLISIGYTETIAAAGWTFINNGITPSPLTFLNGANINGPLTNNGGVTKPTVTFTGTFTIGNNVFLDVIPIIGTGGNVVSFNGANVAFNFNLFGLTINTANLQGTSTVTFTNTNAPLPTTASFTVTTTISLNVVFVNNWIFDVSNVIFTNAFNLNFNLTLAGSALTFLQPTTFSNGILLLSNIGNSITFTNGINSLNGVTFTGFQPILSCTFGNNNQFQITGTSSLSFPNGVTINGCTLTSAATLNIQSAVKTLGGNTTLPAAPTTTFTGTIAFSGNVNPNGGFYSITLGGQVTIPTGNSYSAATVEVILPSTTIFTLSDLSSISSSNSGLFSLNGGIAVGSGCTVNALTAFPAGNSFINGAVRVTWNGNIILRNTNLGGTGDIWFFGNLIAVKGISTITNPIFRFKSTFTLSYLWDQYLPNSGCQLIINSNGNPGNRTIEGSITANGNAGLVFDDNINLNVTTTVTGLPTSTPVGTVTFRTNGQALANITTPQTVTFNGYVLFNHTNFHLMGSGGYFVGANASIFVQGGLNFPSVNGDSIFNITNNVFIGAFVNSTLGSTVFIGAALTTDDLDGNPNVASTTLTLFSLTTQSRNILGNYILGSSLTFGGNVNLYSAFNINSTGTITILGNTLSLYASATWNNKVSLGGAFTVTALNPFTFTFGEQNPPHGLNIPGAFTVLSPATVIFDSIYTINFQSASTLGGNGIITIRNAFIGGNAAVTISPQTLTLTNTTFIGTGTFTISPADQNLNINTLFRSFVPLTYTGNQLNVASNTAISNTVSFSSNPITFVGTGILTVSTGAYSVNTRWVLNNGGVVFLGVVTLQTAGSFGGAGGITFNNTLILTQSTTISNPVTFGQNNNYLVTVSNGGFTLTLTSTTITVAASVVSNGGFIVSTSPSPNLQLISGGGIINSAWTWTNSVQFGSLNVTGTRTLTFNLFLSSGLTTYFTDGITFNGGTFVPFLSTDSPTLEIEKFITTSATTLLSPQITFLIGGSTFNFGGSNVLSVNGTVNCSSTVTFAQNVIFGWSSPTTGNPINLLTGTTAWFVTTSAIQLQLWRTSILLCPNVTVSVYPNIIFGLQTITVTTSNLASLTFYGNLNLLGTLLSGAGTGNTNFGAITISPVQNNTVSGFTLLGSLTFNSTISPFVETVFVPPITGLVQTLVLNGPVRMGNPTFGPQAQILGPARVAITDSLTIFNSAFQFSAPVQLYVSQPLGTFTFTLSGLQAYLTFGTTPSLFNPLGYNLLSAPNFVLNSNLSVSNILKFNLNSPLNIANLAINGGFAQFSQSTTNAAVVNVAGNATLWVDGNAFNANQVIFSQNPDGTSPSYYQLTISSQTPPAITTGAVVYKGVASLVVINFNWNGQAITGITASSANGATANFISTVGTPGYQYQSARAGNNVVFTRTVNPTVSPFPTQSNGPSPGVSSSSILSFNIVLFAIILIFFIFN
jgi:hypothetical protein